MVTNKCTPGVCPPQHRKCIGLTLSLSELQCLIQQLITDQLQNPYQYVTDCLIITVAGAWGEIGDSIQVIRWYDPLQQPPVDYTTTFLNTRTDEVVTGVDETNSRPCATLCQDSCNIDFSSTPSIVINDCGTYYREISADLRVSEDAGNVIEIRDDGVFVPDQPMGEGIVLPQVVVPFGSINAGFTNLGLIDSSKKLLHLYVDNRTDANIEISLDDGVSVMYTAFANSFLHRELGAWVGSLTTSMQIRYQAATVPSIGSAYFDGAY